MVDSYSYNSNNGSGSNIPNEDDDDERLRTISLYFVLFATMLATVMILSKYLHECPRWSSYISEAALILLTGIMVGFVVQLFLPEPEVVAKYTAEGEYYFEPNVLAHSLLSFSPNVFFMALLPPILFNSGYQLRRELFYRHIEPILLFACLGTTLCALVTGFLLYGVSVAGWMGHSSSSNNGNGEEFFAPTVMEFLTFGALVAATDTVSILGVFQAKKVDPHLFNLVVGESALNDAVALVLFTTFATFLKTEFERDALSIAVKALEFSLTLAAQAIGSPLLGAVFSFGAALVFKQVDFRHYPSLELPLYMLLMYTPFVVAECFYLSGIVAIFFCGIFARRYVAPNVSDETEKNAEVIFKLASYMAETCIFLDMGLSVFALPDSFNWPFIAWAFLASLLGRAVGIYPLAFFYNCSLKEPSIPDVECSVTPMDVEGPTQDGLMRLEICEPPERRVSITAMSSSSLSSSPIRRKSRRKTPEKRKDKRISLSMTHVLWFAGLRGAVAYACVRKFPNLLGHTDEFTAAVMIIVLVSIVVMGGATESLLRVLNIDMNVDEEEYMKEWHTKRQLKGTFHMFEYKYLYSMVVREDANVLISVDTSDSVSVASTASAFDYRPETSTE